MTKYTLSWLDKVPGIVEQLFLATLAQEIANQDYIHPAILTNFTADSVQWNLAVNYGSDINQIDLTYQFVLDTFARQAVLDSPTLDRRVSSVNSLHIDEISLVTKSAYPQQSFPVRNLPIYLSTDNVENTLERRIVWLLLQIAAIENWINRWNNCTINWLSRVYDNLSFKPFLPSLAEIELTRDNLIIELNTGIKLAELFGNYGFTVVGEGTIGTEDIDGAQSELAYLSNGASDPANEVANLSSGLLSQLKEQLAEYANEFGAENPEATLFSKSESATLPDC
jgi:hypothetical protein